jgi:dihydroorotate dehydrogenase (NAD+) catalytic subunit
MTDISVQLAPGNSMGLLLANPVITASGTFGYGLEPEIPFDVDRLGAIICKGTTLELREGNPQPRIVETASGMLNSIGLQNIGVDRLIKEKAPAWSKLKVPVIVNIAGSNIDEYARAAAKLNGIKGVSGIELNISCPNVKQGGMEFGSNPEAAAAVTRAVRSETGLPLIVKLSPNVTDICGIAIAVCDAGADALTLINTLRGMAIDINTGKPVLGNIFGGLSGPAIKPVALSIVYRVAKVVKVPIIGCGGVWSAVDAIEFFMAGASAVQVGSVTMRNPLAPLEILNGIVEYLEKKKLKGLKDVVGKAQL